MCPSAGGLFCSAARFKWAEFAAEKRHTPLVWATFATENEPEEPEATGGDNSGRDESWAHLRDPVLPVTVVDRRENEP